MCDENSERWKSARAVRPRPSRAADLPRDFPPFALNRTNRPMGETLPPRDIVGPLTAGQNNSTGGG
jgi:hypothetical protein